jgi:hypothetical protein
MYGAWSKSGGVMRFLDKLWHNLKFNYSYEYRKKIVAEHYEHMLKAYMMMRQINEYVGNRGIYTLQELLEE